MKYLKIGEVVATYPEMCYYSVNTVWWTHSPLDLKTGPVPLDCFGSPLFQTEHVADFLDATKIRSHKSYGKYPLTAFMMAHSQNIEPFLKQHNDKFPGKLADVKGFDTFVPIIEKLVDVGVIPNLEATV